MDKTKRLSKVERIKIITRDNYTCQKCKIEDKSAIKLEVHHITHLVFGGNNDYENPVTLCFTCHKYAPNNKEEFKEYLNSELDGMTTVLLNIYKKLKEEGITYKKTIND